MSTRNLLHHHLRRHYSTTLTTKPSPPPPNLMIYDRLTEAVRSKLLRLNSPDPRFLRYTSPHPIPSDHSHILRFPTTSTTTLPNGLRVATESALASRSASISVSVDAGSRFEGEAMSGVAYFWERIVMAMKSEGLVSIGADLDSVTTREKSVFSARVLSRDALKSVDTLGEILQCKDFDDALVEEVRGSILREKEKSVEDEQAIFDQLHATAYQYTPLGRPVHGSLSNMKSISKADIQEYISSHYAAHRLVISASGAVKHEDVVEQVKKAFTKLSANPTTTSQLVASEPANFTGSEVRIIDDDLPLARFGVAFEGASWRDPDSIPLLVIQTMLGSWSKNNGNGKHAGSNLVQMAAINEIAESFKSFNINYNDTGLFGVYAVAKPDCLDDLAYAIMHEIGKLSYRVNDEDVIRACNQLKSSLLLQSNGVGAASEDIGHQLLSYGRRIPFAELFARIDAVDASAVKRVANRFIFDREVAIAAMGPIKGLPDYNWFRRRTYWLRY